MNRAERLAAELGRLAAEDERAGLDPVRAWRGTDIAAEGFYRWEGRMSRFDAAEYRLRESAPWPEEEA
jgi:hypothetical protein